jgi:hypothetical protein
VGTSFLSGPETILVIFYMFSNFPHKSDEVPLFQICYICCANWFNVRNDSLAGKHSIPVYFCCICTNVEGN